MAFWMAICAASLAANALLAWFLYGVRRRESAQALEIASLRHECKRLYDSENDLRGRAAALLDSSLVGMLFWEGPIAEADGAAGRVSGNANSALRSMLGNAAGGTPDGGPHAGGAPGTAAADDRTRAAGVLPIAPASPLWGPEQWRELSAGGSCAPFSIECRRADGGRLELLASASLRRDGGHYLAVDVTRLADARHDLQRSQVMYQVLAQNSPVGIWQIRPDRSTLFINPAMLAVLEHDTPEELMASPEAWFECFTPESLAIIDREIAKRIRGVASHYEVEVVGRWGRHTRMLVHGAPIFSPDGTLDSLMGIYIDVTEQRREEEALRQSEERLRVAARFGNDLVYEWNIASDRLDWFGPIAESLGITDGDIPRTSELFESMIHPEDAPRVNAAFEGHMAGKRDIFHAEYRIMGRDGRWRQWVDKGVAILDSAGHPYKWIGACIDVTESKLAEEALRVKEEQLRQSQKLEAVGRLAGGIAHDFNNLLAAIMGYCELMGLRLEPGHPCRREVGEILGSSERAAGLIRQLLAFSRQEIPQPKVINPNLVLTSMERMLRHLLEETIDLRLQADAKAGRVRIDPVQLEQVIMNLVVNARDAMAGGGVLVLSTGNVELKGDLPGAYGRIRPGPYVRVSVADSGQGIDKEHLPHIFDPFYTTKDRGKGSGLGLSTVYGIVTQNQGCVLVETEAGKGSVFSFFLPQTTEEAETETEVVKALRASAIVPKTVLLVEDDAEVRKIVRELLGQQGFLVLEASKGAEAMALAEKYDQPLHLLLTDVVLPGMGGKDLADSLRKAIPGLRVLFMSGYTQDAAFRDELSGGHQAFIQKPFTLTALLGKIREVLI